MNFVAAALCVLLVGVPLVSAQCYTSGNCYNCVSYSGCGWNGYSLTCQSGNSAGPYSGYTSEWYYGQCYSYISAGSTYVYVTSSYGFWSVTSWGLWLCVVGFIVFWTFVGSCCYYRRRRAVYVTTTVAQPLNAGYVVGVQQTAYAPAPAAYAYGQPAAASPYGQPAPAAYGQPAPAQQAYGQPQQQQQCQPAPAPPPTGGLYG